MANFTKGPWKQKKHDGAGRTFELKREFWEVGGGPDKAGVAFVFGGQANANVVAAAPEMYEALNFFLERHIEMVNSGDCGSWNPETDAEVIKARAALAKAEGKSNG